MAQLAIPIYDPYAAFGGRDDNGSFTGGGLRMIRPLAADKMECTVGVGSPYLFADQCESGPVLVRAKITTIIMVPLRPVEATETTLGACADPNDARR